MPIPTKRIIADSFLSLVKKKSVDKITVKELVENCNISRQTFYYHFQDITAVLEWICEDAFDRAIRSNTPSDAPHVVFRNLINAVNDSRIFFQRLMSSQKYTQVHNLLTKSVRTYLEEMGKARRDGQKSSLSKRETVLDFCSIGISGLLLNACARPQTNQDELAEQIAELISRLVPK